MPKLENFPVVTLGIFLLVAAAIVGGSLMFSARYALVAAGEKNQLWRIDRLTGNVHVCTSSQSGFTILSCSGPLALKPWP